ncbi:NAD-dependent epimerase/dehydratase family protein [Planococcus citreus]|uniref:UDP-glucose 4-epimerase n=1 Tax=Planococcus citreus TaxID=1373 RepID=A0A497YLN2_9BACL|nr:NAD-dependent epimerase/dehydratase family protein [Planococcus citreus]RLJ90670.1 UDP-glucose 4-epimerase [Planococcus citreus]
MKKILITGENSYVGSSLKAWLSKHPVIYSVDTISLRDNQWKEVSFAGYDTVLHTVGIAHVEAKPEMEDLYYKINRDLTIEAAKKSKDDKVKQFIFLSSIIVYGDSSKINQPRIIDENTIPTPANFYGNSKLQAEKGILPLENDDFKVVIIRPPMIYGKESKGNYRKLVKVASKLPVFPEVNNERSMLHIDNLCEFIRLLIDNEEKGIFFPQNAEYVKTSEMVKVIAEVQGKKIKLTKIFNPFVVGVGKYVKITNKIFGNLVYKQSLSEYKNEYRIKDFRESIEDSK